VKFDCSYSELLDINSSKIIPNPKNPNNHPKDQIERLSKIIEYQGQRHPIIISNRSGFLVVGHGRLEAIKKLGWEKIAVSYQDFENEAQEYSFVVSDNAIASWSELDLGKVNQEMLDLGPDFDVELLGVKDFTIEIADKTKDKEVDLDFNYKLEVDCIDEDKQQMLLMELQDRDFKVRVLL
jgi:hypothetical protein